MRTSSILASITNWVFLFFVSLLAIYIISSNFNIFGEYRTFLVQSGSMEPSIMTGDIILVKKQDAYIKNDTITFQNSSERIVTHRIVDIKNDEEDMFYTKGDANRSGDEDIIPLSNVFGRVIIVIPKLGFLVAFSKSWYGFLILVLIPLILYVVDEILKIKND